MRLYLIQHGQAKSADVDPDRHLTETGQQDVEKMHGFLKPMNLRVNDIWHSGKVRAAETAEILSPAISATHGLIQRQ
ncbi:MAG: hypothetical protein DSY99_02015 [Candidatus Neomarinimicrobiota bacterium]|nr:MAG: hypothetical protein DSY99_02015 [Candidatus Neomarinimicrobiota bacterium]